MAKGVGSRAKQRFRQPEAPRKRWTVAGKQGLQDRPRYTAGEPARYSARRNRRAVTRLALCCPPSHVEKVRHFHSHSRSSRRVQPPPASPTLRPNPVGAAPAVCGSRVAGGAKGSNGYPTNRPASHPASPPTVHGQLTQASGTRGNGAGDSLSGLLSPSLPLLPLEQPPRRATVDVRPAGRTEVHDQSSLVERRPSLVGSVRWQWMEGCQREGGGKGMGGEVGRRRSSARLRHCPPARPPVLPPPGTQR